MSNLIILSLFDYSGRWAFPFIKYGYSIITHDIKMPTSEFMYPERIHIQGDILKFNYKDLPKPDIILSAVPCTHFALAGAKHFAIKDSDGRTDNDIKLVYKTLEIIDYFKPRVWAIENPASRIHKLVPQLGSPKLKFHPCDYGDPYRKATWLWGQFNIPTKNPIEPPPRNLKGFDPWYNKVGGKSEKTKEYRSMTPMGFAEAFADANYDKNTTS